MLPENICQALEGHCLPAFHVVRDRQSRMVADQELGRWPDRETLDARDRGTASRSLERASCGDGGSVCPHGPCQYARGRGRGLIRSRHIEKMLR